MMDDAQIKKWIAQVFGEQAPPDAPDFFVGQVMNRLRQPAPQPVRGSPRQAWWWVPALAPALVLLLLVLGRIGPSVSTEALLGTGGSWDSGIRLAQRPSAEDLLNSLAVEET